MCYSPIIVSKPQAKQTFIRRLYDARLSDVVRSKVVKTAFSCIQVPCGKCLDCLRQKQNDLATRVVRQAKRDGNFVFVTLTYNEDNIPVSCSTQLVDKQTGEMIRNEFPLISKNIDIHRKIVGLSITNQPRYIDELYEDYSSDYALNVRFTPSLDREGFRLYLKRKRVEFKRAGKELPPFKYVAVGEYGPKTCRPHMHVCITGLDKKIVEDLFHEWNVKFGDVRVQQVKLVNGDGSFGFAIAAKYVGKYMSKGKFECPSVLNGFAQKPRVCISRDFGTFLTQYEIDYYMVYDLFGFYNKNDLSHFAEYQLNMLVSEINKRARVDIFGYKYLLPHNIQKKLFYEKVENEKNQVRYQATQIQALRNYALQEQYCDSLLRELRQAGIEFDSKSFFSALQKVSLSQSLHSFYKRKKQEESLSSFYGQSYF